MHQGVLEIQGVKKSFGATQALKGVSFPLQGGEIFGLIGLNGAGKTTLIKIILDLVQADEGEVKLFGASSREPEARKNLVYLPEKFQPSRYLRGYEYVEIALSYYRQQRERGEIAAMAERLELNVQALDRRVGTYSKGMGQKLGLMAALLTRVPLLILDEPMSGLDPQARIRLKDQLLAAKASGRTVFFSSHILSDIDEICDRIGVIHHGDLLYLGAPQPFKEKYPGGSLEKAFLSAIEGEGARRAA